jgi:hypothetical protein
MKKAERTERMRALSRLALGILRRCGDRAIIDRDGVSYRSSQVRHNEFKLTLSRPIGDADRASKLTVRFDGATVLQVEWTSDAVERTSYRPGKWEATLSRYDRAPVLAGRSGS